MFDKYWSQVPSTYRLPLLLTSCTAIVLTPLVWRRLTYRPELLPPFSRNRSRRYERVQDSSSTLSLLDGRKIGYAQYGDLGGKPVICLHGILGSRLENALFDANARELGIRIIGIERPGMGLSSPDARPLKDKSMLDHAHDVQLLVEHLHLKDYAVLGTSGGAPYAFACASFLPSSPSRPRLRAVSVVTPLGLSDMSQAWPAPLVFLNKHLDLRWLIKMMIARGPVWDLQLSDEERMEGFRQGFDLKKAHPADLETTARPDYPDMVELFIKSSREAISQGWQGFLNDSAILSADPGFRIQDIDPKLPIQIWCGTDDTNVSPKAGQEYVERLRTGGNQNVELHEQAGQTHGSTQVKFQRKVLEDLLKAMDQ
jgi:pimeloyl-ACP methyl ester carboxylesterase